MIFIQLPVEVTIPGVILQVHAWGHMLTRFKQVIDTMSDSFTYNEMNQALASAGGNPGEKRNITTTRGGNNPIDGWVAQERDDYTADGPIADAQASAASARIYEWNDEYGDIGPKIPDLENELFGDPENRGEGLDFSK